MNKDILYKFFEGNASFEEEAAVKQWMEESAELSQSLWEEVIFIISLRWKKN